ncbi:cysteine desulfurase [Planctomyces sp. SH-PL14]|uniref:cysteine desulfurase n=1 Tax=Planctomyces sp. SH-PL14 TaxID=1632864 RepID=UPI00078BCBB8|nr:cysteine desulfurase [Planctomyces sp. SH-PL14]AMV22077.1 Cysteine desulfurase [Planctomyces sp. SH-PL14]
MNEITPDLVAQIATRLYNANPHSGPDPASSLPAGTPSFEGPPAVPTAPSLPQVGPLPAQPSSVQTISSPTSFPFSPSGHSGSAAPWSGFGGTGHSGFSHSGAGQQDGLREFVKRVQSTDHRGTSGLCSGPDDNGFLQRLLSRTAPPGPSRPLDVDAVRRDFPILNQRIHGKPLVWLDNAATTQKPNSVIDAISHFYRNDNSNIHRAAHSLAARATDAYEGAREKVQKFLGAASPKEIIFVRGTTEGINLVAQTYGRKFLQPGDEIVLSTLEHHANIVPWQAVAREKGAVLRVIPVNDRGEIKMEEYQALLGPRTKIVTLSHASNSLGTILPIAEMIPLAKRYGARVLIDGAQTVSHIPVNVQQLDCDFFVFSGHKIFGPTGIGAVYAKPEVQELMPPWQGGGNMIRNVTFEETTFSDPPAKFEAGTPNIADAVGLGAALDYVSRLGLPNIAKYEHELLEYGTHKLSEIDGLRLVGTAREKVGVLSFVLANRRVEEVGRALDLEGIAVRAGHHCSQPSLRRFGLEATVRPSLAFYNTRAEIDHLADAIRRIRFR